MRQWVADQLERLSDWFDFAAMAAVRRPGGLWRWRVLFAASRWLSEIGWRVLFSRRPFGWGKP